MHAEDPQVPTRSKRSPNFSLLLEESLARFKLGNLSDETLHGAIRKLIRIMILTRRRLLGPARVDFQILKFEAAESPFCRVSILFCFLIKMLISDRRGQDSPIRNLLI